MPIDLAIEGDEAKGDAEYNNDSKDDSKDGGVLFHTLLSEEYDPITNPDNARVMTTNSPDRLDRLEALAETTLLTVQQQQVQINDLRASIADVVGMVGTLAEQQNEMQQEINQTKLEIKGLQLESRRILDYLLNQRGDESP
jgi:hypothetical protein